MSQVSRVIRFVVLILAAAVLLVCSNDDSADNPSGPSGTDTLTITPSATSAPPTSWVRVSGIPAGADDLYGIVLDADSAASPLAAAVAVDTGLAVVFRTDSGDYMVTPLNPSDPLNGGDVLIVITDGKNVVSEPIKFTLDTLPAAPGESEAILSLLQTQLGHMMRLAGTSRDSLDNLVVDDIPLEHLALVFAYNAIDSPDNPNSLRAILDRTSPAFSADSAMWELTDRLLANTGYRDHLEDLVARLDTMAVPEVAPHRRITLREAAASGQACIPAPNMGITDCASLADAMNRQQELQDATTDLSDKVIADGISNTILVLGLIPGSQVPIVMAGGMVWGEAKMNDAYLKMLPGDFVSGQASFDPSELEFDEDFTEDGEWTRFHVTAQSQGLNLDAAIFEAILQALAGKGAADNFGELAPNNIGEIVDRMDETVNTAFVASGSANAVVQKFGNESGLIEICGRTWDDIDCVDPDYSDMIVSSGSLEIEEQQKKYRPTEVGSAILRMETSSAFNGEKTGDARTINTNQIEVFIDPFQAEADTSEELFFSARVENAENTAVEWTLEGGGTFFPDNNLVTVFTPDQEWDPPMTLKARSLATTGLRQGSGDERDDEALITYNGEGEAFISPNFICVKNGQPQEFVVNYTGSSIDSVRWELDPPGFGTLDESGGPEATYNAPPSESGSVKVRATVNGASTAIADVSVSSCVCAWNFEAVGSGYAYSESGNWSSARDLGGLSVSMKETEDGFRPLVLFVAYNANDTGTFDVAAITFEGTDLVSWGLSDPDSPLPVLQITGYESADFVEGSMTGELSRIVSFTPGEVEYEYMTFSLTFRGEFFNLDRPKCVDD